MSTILCIRRYNNGDEMHASDQITVHSRVWEDLHREHNNGTRPLFVEIAEIGSTNSIIGRVAPSAGSKHVSLDTCIIPDWMWLALGAPEELWISLQRIDIPDAGSIRLRPRNSHMLAVLDNPLEALTAALSGSAGGPSWACLNQNVGLPLTFGDFDILEIKSIEGYPVPAACILNLDVDLELDEAPNSICRPPTPIPTIMFPPVLIPPAEFEPPKGVMWFSGMEKIVGCKR